ncbi:hypothetical protein AVEN_186977-1 [Araneus ventricosus]|uniref:Uncharacterized protein n=1 Tax=Araneus ventricosus TaxID=182803 RepID=A0A4Y2UPX6_ARAVE|nr:hypothetical protein AVEN_186977-1 [Araneus ventricosus]
MRQGPFLNPPFYSTDPHPSQIQHPHLLGPPLVGIKNDAITPVSLQQPLKKNYSKKKKPLSSSSDRPVPRHLVSADHPLSIPFHNNKGQKAFLLFLRNRRGVPLPDLNPEWEQRGKPAGVFSPKLSRILPQKGAVSPSPAWLKKFEPTVIQNPMTIRRFFIIVNEKYLGTWYLHVPIQGLEELDIELSQAQLDTSGLDNGQVHNLLSLSDSQMSLP